MAHIDFNPLAPAQPAPFVIDNALDDAGLATISAAKAMQDALGLANAEVARRAGLAGSTYSEVKNLKYKGNYAVPLDRLQKWVSSEEQRMMTSAGGLPSLGYIETSVAKQIVTAIRFAQSRPGMVLVTVGAGLGKTMCLRHYEAHNNDAYRVVIEPTDSRRQTAIRKIAATLGVQGHHTLPILTEIKRQLTRDSRQPVLLIDEAQNLSGEAVNQLRFLLDEVGCGIVLAGNEDLMTRYSMAASREGYGQVQRRIFMRVHIKTAPQVDIDLLVSKLGITDPAILRLCRQIGVRVGGLGQVVETLEFASQIAFGAGRTIAAEDVRAAWMNRTREDIR